MGAGLVDGHKEDGGKSLDLAGELWVDEADDVVATEGCEGVDGICAGVSSAPSSRSE